MTLEQAKELSAKKWELLVKYDGNEHQVVKELPILVPFRHKCAMCEYIWEEQELKCKNCLYDGLCIGHKYNDYLHTPSEETSKKVYKEILKRNKK